MSHPSRKHNMNRILREVERIPALLLLPDSALRVTSATASDGRLAALALYLLGAAVRAADNTAAAATAAGAPQKALAAAPRAATGELAGTADSKKAVGDAVADALSDPDGIASGAVPSAVVEAAAPRVESGSLAAPKSTAVAGGKGSGQEQREGIFDTETEGVEDGGGGSIVGQAPLAATTSGEDAGVAVSPREGDVVQDDDAAGEAGVTSPDERQGEEGGGGGPMRQLPGTEGQQEGQDEQTSFAAAVAAAEAVAAAAEAAADAEDIKRDQRFEQLVEIIECVTTELSVSDMSKVRMIRYLL